MPEQDYTVTENLTQVIDTIQLGHKTGVLTVQRGEGPALEGGMIIFVSGRPVRAQVGYLNTAESLERLAFWRECRFAFLPYIPPDLTLAPSALLPSKNTPLPPPQPITGRYPALPGAQPNTGSNPGFPVSQPNTGSNPGFPVSQPNTGSNPGFPVSQPITGGNPAFPGFQPRLPSFLYSAPYRVRQVDEAMYIMEQQGFPRIYRRLLLLLDGSRTIVELAQLFGQSPDEVYQLVSHLEAAGLVRH